MKNSNQIQTVQTIKNNKVEIVMNNLTGYKRQHQQQQELNALELIAVVAVALFFLSKILFKTLKYLSILTYNLGKYLGQLYFSSKYPELIKEKIKEKVEDHVPSETRKAFTTETTVIVEQLGKFLMGYCLIYSYSQSFYLDVLEALDRLKRILKLHIMNFTMKVSLA